MEDFVKSVNCFSCELFSQKVNIQYYNCLISGDNKFVPDKCHPRVNKNTLEFEKQLKRDNATDNVVCEIKWLQARCKDSHLKVLQIDESVLNKIENLTKDNNTKLLIKECYQTIKKKK